jgi:hypothetical protein
MGLPLPGYALLQTKGRKTGKPRRTPVGDGRIGKQFWLVAEHGMKAGYVRNIERDPVWSKKSFADCSTRKSIVMGSGLVLIGSRSQAATSIQAVAQTQYPKQGPSPAYAALRS